jgi:hypothetical protein
LHTAQGQVEAAALEKVQIQLIEHNVAVLSVGADTRVRVKIHVWVATAVATVATPDCQPCFQASVVGETQVGAIADSQCELVTVVDAAIA